MEEPFANSPEVRVQLAEQWLLGELMALAHFDPYPSQEDIDQALGLRTGNGDLEQASNSPM